MFEPTTVQARLDLGPIKLSFDAMIPEYMAKREQEMKDALEKAFADFDFQAELQAMAKTAIRKCLDECVMDLFRYRGPTRKQFENLVLAILEDRAKPATKDPE